MIIVLNSVLMFIAYSRFASAINSACFTCFEVLKAAFELEFPHQLVFPFHYQKLPHKEASED